MSDKNTAAFETLLTPIIKMLLENGITHKEFMQLCKAIYVKVATEDYGVNGRPTNVSRVALLTGLDRKEVKRLKDGWTQGRPLDTDQTDRLSRILSGWHQDKDFLDEHNKPRMLSLKGDSGSFFELIKRYAGDVPPGAVLKELERLKAVEINVAGLIKVKKRYYIPPNNDQAAVLRAGQVICDIGTTLNNNLYKTCQQDSKRFERRATNPFVNRHDIDEFRYVMQQEGQRFLERIDAWLGEHETEDESRQVRLGAGVYWIQGD